MCVSVPRVCLASPQALEGIRSSGTRVTDGREPTWLLGTEHGSSPRASSARSWALHGAMSQPLPPPTPYLFYCCLTFRFGECPGVAKRSFSRFLWVSGAEHKQAGELRAWVSTEQVMAGAHVCDSSLEEPASARLTWGP